MLVWVNVLFSLGLIWNALLFLFQANRIRRTASVHGVSLFMFLGFNIGQALGVINGVVFQDPTLLYGFLLSFVACYVVTSQIIYYRLAHKRWATAWYWMVGIVLAFSVVVWLFLQVPDTKLISSLSYGVELVWNAFLFVSQSISLARSKDPKNLSLLMFLGFNAIQLLAVLNGIMYKDAGLYIGSGLSFITCFIVSVQIVYYRFR